MVTGGAGFIGSALVRKLVQSTDYQVINVDKLTYAGNLESLVDVLGRPRHVFEQVDICNQAELRRIFEQYRPFAIMHLAAESHVDRSIDGPGEFVRVNIEGTFRLLEEARRYWLDLDVKARARFRFVHVSTDEVFGSLGDEGYFTPSTPYSPNSPYSASKAASDHLARAWQHTYGLPVIVTNCSNNYGPRQFPEKLIPLMVLNARDGKTLPVYGAGLNVRDWLFVEDHVEGLLGALERGRIGGTYLFGGGAERRNIDVVKLICVIMDELRPLNRPHEQLIRYVADRPGHDLRYAIDASGTRAELGWRPRESFETGLRKTIEWYLENEGWCERVLSGEYRRERLGLRAV